MQGPFEQNLATIAKAMVGERGIKGYGFVGRSVDIKEGRIALVDPRIINHRTPKIQNAMYLGLKTLIARIPVHQAIFC